jgi:hypothetical protein
MNLQRALNAGKETKSAAASRTRVPPVAGEEEARAKALQRQWLVRKVEGMAAEQKAVG